MEDSDELYRHYSFMLDRAAECMYWELKRMRHERRKTGAKYCDTYRLEHRVYRFMDLLIQRDNELQKDAMLKEQFKKERKQARKALAERCNKKTPE